MHYIHLLSTPQTTNTSQIMGEKNKRMLHKFQSNNITHTKEFIIPFNIRNIAVGVQGCIKLIILSTPTLQTQGEPIHSRLRFYQYGRYMLRISNTRSPLLLQLKCHAQYCHKKESLQNCTTCLKAVENVLHKQVTT